VEALLPALREGVARVDASSEEGRAIRAALADVEATLAKLRQQQEQQGQQQSWQGQGGCAATGEVPSRTAAASDAVR